MPNRKEYGRTDQPEEIGGEEGAAQQLKPILASGLPPLYRIAYRTLGNSAGAEDALQDALLAAYTHWTNSGDRHRSPPGRLRSCLIAPDCSYAGGQDISTCRSTNPVRNCYRFQSRSGWRITGLMRGSMQRVRTTGAVDSFKQAALSHSAQDISVARRRWFIDPRNCADFGNTKRHCESSVNTSSQGTQRIDASHSQIAISKAAKSIVGFCKFDKLACRARTAVSIAQVS
jgi:hypothetical protein